MLPPRAGISFHSAYSRMQTADAVDRFYSGAAVLEVFCKGHSTAEKRAQICGADSSLCAAVDCGRCCIEVYNTLRFGSPVDFGANYNLTTNDMTRRGFVLDRIGLGIFSYLFQTPNMISQFPFFAGTAMETSYMGTTVSDTMYGGLFTSNIILLAGCFFYDSEAP